MSFLCSYELDKTITRGQFLEIIDIQFFVIK